jgi:DNA-binding CsgD family transcriptional regulator
MPHLEERPLEIPTVCLPDILLGLDEPQAAFDLVARVLPVNAIDPRELDVLLIRGARAAGDLVREASDRRDQSAVRRHREALDRLMAARDALPGVAFALSGPGDVQHSARGAIFAAEVARTRGADQVVPWQEAASASARAAMEWEQRAAELGLASALVESGAPARDVAALLRGIHAYAEEQGATPMKQAVEELAATARVSLAEPVVPPLEGVPAAFAGLTARESEVLGHLVANRTYAEIADALFISEKTVSVHVSNLLRKTGTGSRREVSALARRVGFATREE